MRNATARTGPRSWLTRRARLQYAAQDARLTAVEERVETLLDVVHEACELAGVPVDVLTTSRPVLRLVTSEARQTQR